MDGRARAASWALAGPRGSPEIGRSPGARRRLAADPPPAQRQACGIIDPTCRHDSCS